MRRPEVVDHGKRTDLLPDSVDDQRVTFVMTDGIARPGRPDLRRMRLVQAHVSDFVIEDIEKRDHIRLLEHPHAEVPENKRHAARPTLVARIGSRPAAQLDIAVRLHGLRRPRLEDRIGVIADELRVVADEWNVRTGKGAPIIVHRLPPARLVRHGTRTRSRRRHAGKRKAPPGAGEIRDRGGRWRTAVDRRRWRHPLSASGHRGCRQDQIDK